MSTSDSSEEDFHDIEWVNEDPLFGYVEFVEYPQIQCVLQGDVEGLKELLEAGRSVNITNNQGNTPLHHAVLYEKEEMFKFVLTVEDLQINTRNYRGQTPLLVSIDCEDTIYGQKLLELGADPNSGSDDNITPLHEVQSAEVAKMLIENGAHLNAQTVSNGETPLFTACLHNRDEIAHLLLYYGANPTIPNKNGLTCLSIAMWGSRTELGQILWPYFTEIEEEGKVALCLYEFYIAMKHSSAIFPQLFKACTKILHTNGHLETFAVGLLTFDTSYFKHFIAKFKPILVSMFEYYRCCPPRKKCIFHHGELSHGISNLNSLDENNLLTDTVNLLLSYCDYFVDFDFITDQSVSYDEQMQLTVSLISHGLPLKFESCDYYISREQSSFLMVALIAEVPLTIEHCVKSPKKYIFESSVLDLLEHFALWELQQFCIIKFEQNEAIQAKLKTLPTVPKLLELARNTTRRHIVQKFEITCSRHLYTYIDCLKISQVYKDLLSFKKKLYL